MEILMDSLKQKKLVAIGIRRRGQKGFKVKSQLNLPKFKRYEVIIKIVAKKLPPEVYIN